MILFMELIEKNPKRIAELILKIEPLASGQRVEFSEIERDIILSGLDMLKQQFIDPI